MLIWGRKDCFPGADGSTIPLNAHTGADIIPIYGANNNELAEGSETGFRIVKITTSGVLNGDNSQLYAIQNPLTFIANAESTGDWYTNNEMYQNDDLWEIHKTCFDPCPKGWQVAPEKTLDDFSTSTAPYYIQGTQTSSGDFYTTNGRLYNSITWYPTSGYTTTYGTLSSAGYGGYYWLTQAVDGKAARIYFSPSSISNNPIYRAGSYPVRCIQE